VAGMDNQLRGLTLDYQYDLAKDQGLRLSYKWDELETQSISEWRIRLLRYF